MYLQRMERWEWGGGGMSSAITQNQDIRMVVSLSSGDHYHRSTSTCPYPRVYCHKALPRIDADLLCLKYHQPVFQVITNVFLQKYHRPLHEVSMTLSFPTCHQPSPQVSMTLSFPTFHYFPQSHCLYSISVCTAAATGQY